MPVPTHMQGQLQAGWESFWHPGKGGTSESSQEKHHCVCVQNRMLFALGSRCGNVHNWYYSGVWKKNLPQKQVLILNIIFLGLFWELYSGQKPPLLIL